MKQHYLIFLLLAGILRCLSYWLDKLVDERKGLFFRGNGLKNNSVDYSVTKNLTLSTLTSKSFFKLLNKNLQIPVVGIDTLTV